MRLAQLVFLGSLTFLLAGSEARADKPTFPLQEGDTWVMVGDSITAQHLHSNYFEAFCYARYPTMNFRFRNSGVGGDTIPKVLARFDWDVAAWKPTVVSVELGMNDKGGFTTPKFIANMAALDEKIRGIKARPVYFSASPVNNGEISPKLVGNARLREYALALKDFAAEKKAPYGDQFDQLIDLWGKNKPRENVARNLASIKELADDDSLPGVEHLRAFLAAQAKSSTAPVSMGGDPVHPGPTGQLMMAAALLRALGAEGFVSSVVIDGEGKAQVKGCKVEGLKKDDDKIVFERTDESLPFPIPDEARAVLPLFPTILELSQYTLTIKGLKAENYNLKINGELVGTIPSADLEKGVNLTTFARGPIATQGKAILAAVAAKEGLVGAWRPLSNKVHSGKENKADTDNLMGLTKKVGEADAKIKAVAKPHLLRFELTAAR